MTNLKKGNATSLLEIQKEDIADVAVFLNKYMSDRFSPEEWGRAMLVAWLDDAPNHGFMVKDSDNNVVGALCVIYSEQSINGKKERICNPHSWCVLPAYRSSSVQLVLAAIRQRDFHFTMFTPNESGLEIFAYLKFKPLGNSVTTLLHVPSLSFSSKMTFFSDEEEGMNVLSPTDLKVFKDHMAFPWLDRLIFKSREKSGFILYKKLKFKRLPSARVLYISDRDLFFSNWQQVRTYLLRRRGLFTSRMETRFLEKSVSFSLQPEPDQQKFYLSSSLAPDDIECIYSELVVLDLYG